MDGHGEPIDLELESSRGGRRRLSSLRGRVVALMWEDRSHRHTNERLKAELARLAARPASNAVVLAVADVSAFDFAPARGLVRSGVAGLSRVIGVDILLDWTAALANAPFDLQRGASNLLVLDHDGRPRLRRSGELDASERRAVIDLIRRLEGAASQTAA